MIWLNIRRNQSLSYDIYSNEKDDTHQRNVHQNRVIFCTWTKDPLNQIYTILVKLSREPATAWTTKQERKEKMEHSMDLSKWRKNSSTLEALLKVLSIHIIGSLNRLSALWMARMWLVWFYDNHEKTFSLLSELRELYATFHFKLSIHPLSHSS